MTCLFEVDRTVFEKALFGVQNVAQKRTATPILSNTRIDAETGRLRLYATDYDVGITQWIDADVQNVGSAALPARMLYEIVKRGTGDLVRIEVDDQHQAVIQTGPRARYKLVGMEPADFPEPPPVTTSARLELDRELFRLWIRKTLFAAGTDDSRAALAGVFVEPSEQDDLRLVATDTHRLAMVELPGIEGASALPAEGVILPRKALGELLAISEGDGTIELGVQVQEGGQQQYIQARWDQTELLFRTVDGRFPSYRAVIPEETRQTAVIDRSDFIAAIERVSLVITERFRAVSLRFSADTLTVQARNPEMGEGEEQLDCSFDGEDGFEVGFNAQYLQDALNQITTDRIELRMIDDISPTLIFGEADETYLNVIMPMRL
ncbi:MAG: DNA polymerase III subunit beta [Candidatus Dadabacteria bacterium]|nr:MAG: DNA polymerase III subunit beta [Candidatus Dadabacteria bacterium]